MLSISVLAIKTFTLSKLEVILETTRVEVNKLLSVRAESLRVEV